MNFDPTSYRHSYGLPATVSPLAHDLAHRHRQTFSPLPAFDVTGYVEADASTLRPNPEPYAHFLVDGQAGLERAV